METATRPKYVVEYSQVGDNWSHTTTLAKGTRHYGYKDDLVHEYTLSHRSPGYESAGSMARWTDERWSVLFVCDGATHGRSFSTEQAAREHFERVTQAAE